jgi:hypothetical protein
MHQCFQLWNFEELRECSFSVFVPLKIKFAFQIAKIYEFYLLEEINISSNYEVLLSLCIYIHFKNSKVRSWEHYYLWVKISSFAVYTFGQFHTLVFWNLWEFFSFILTLLAKWVLKISAIGYDIGMVFFSVLGNQTQGLTHVKQVLFQWVTPLSNGMIIYYIN